jgi:hypothetical protein
MEKDPEIARAIGDVSMVNTCLSDGPLVAFVTDDLFNIAEPILRF